LYCQANHKSANRWWADSIDDDEDDDDNDDDDEDDGAENDDRGDDRGDRGEVPDGAALF